MHAFRLTRFTDPFYRPVLPVLPTRFTDPFYRLTRFTNPNNNIRIMDAKPSASYLSQQRPYIKIQMHGRNYDAHGNIVPNKSTESHIPQSEFDPTPFEGVLPE